jgi:hypothetical protein
MILALGVAKLFLLPRGAAAVDEDSLPSWLRIDSFNELKVLLWESILMALVIIALSALTAGLLEKLEWTALVLPAAIALLALSLYLMKRA